MDRSPHTAYAQRVKRTHQLAYRALAERIVGLDIAQTEATLARLLTLQLPREAGAFAGFFPWTIAERGVRDRNSIEFVSLPLALLLRKYEGCFTPAFRERLKSTLALAAEGLEKGAVRRVKIGYTNIWIMNSLALALIGGALRDPRWAKQGYEQLTAFAELIEQNGITEYDSPTYYGVDVMALHAARGLLAKEKGREVVGKILDQFWTSPRIFSLRAGRYRALTAATTIFFGGAVCSTMLRSSSSDFASSPTNRTRPI